MNRLCWWLGHDWEQGHRDQYCRRCYLPEHYAEFDPPHPAIIERTVNAYRRFCDGLRRLDYFIHSPCAGCGKTRWIFGREINPGQHEYCPPF